MPLYHLIILAIIQGVTEFLPISSSGHLILIPHLMEIPDQGLLVDIAVHIGSLLAVMLYFAEDIKKILLSPSDLIKGKRTQHSFILGWIILATLPIVFFGGLYHAYWPNGMRSVEIIAWATILFGILLGIADRCEEKATNLHQLGWRKALIIGGAQVLALIPGTSRSGITMTAARFMNLSRAEASRFSFLISIPTIAGAGVIGLIDLLETKQATVSLDALIAFLLAFITAFSSIHLLMKWVEKHSFRPFVMYRIVLGIGLLLWVYL